MNLKEICGKPEAMQMSIKICEINKNMFICNATEQNNGTHNFEGNMPDAKQYLLYNSIQAKLTTVRFRIL